MKQHTTDKLNYPSKLHVYPLADANSLLNPVTLVYNNRLQSSQLVLVLAVASNTALNTSDPSL